VVLATAEDIRHHEARLAREPSSQAYAALAEAYRRGARLDEAIRVCRQGLERYPTYSTARFVLAKALLDGDQVSEARIEVERFLQAEPDHEPALRIAAECALRLADPRAALGHLRRLGVLDPEDRATQGQLRALEVATGRERGRAESGGLWPVLADDTFATVTFGDLCVAQGLLDEATAVFGRIVLRSPDHAVARARLADLGRARIQARRPRT
jgi:tetratricopeptide (TPR) repeat protein